MEEKKNLWSSYDEAAKKELHEINEKYKACLDAGKTERECVKLAVEMAKEAGYQDIKDVLKEGKSLKAGDKVYAVCMEKMLAMFRMGEEPLSNGMNILGAHIDSPRIDVKQNPLYESEGMAYLDTHYYGGIKKYQWVTGPMALHGVVAKKDGSVEEISIGEKESDPVFVITDLLVHLAANQMSKKASEVIEGEKLDLLIGNSPLDKAEGLDEEEKKIVSSFNLITLKPIIYALNVNDEDVLSGNEYTERVNLYANEEGSLTVTLCAKLESELSELNDDDKREFLNDIGISKSGLDLLIQKTYDLLGLATFFTVGADEVRAWTFKKGMKAPECAGIIHTDFQKGFIKAEVMSYDDLISAGSEAKVKENGKLRIEGKEYVMQDGDICHFRFNL